MLYLPKGLHGKFDSLWRGPFKIKEVCGKYSFILSYVSGTQLTLAYNGQHLKHYHEQKVSYQFVLFYFLFFVVLFLVFIPPSCKLVPQMTLFFSPCPQLEPVVTQSSNVSILNLLIPLVMCEICPILIIEMIILSLSFCEFLNLHIFGSFLALPKI